MPTALAPSTKQLSIRLSLTFAPYAHLDSIQQSTVCKFAKLKDLRAIVWWKVGLGKTRLALSLLALLFQKQNGKCPFVSVIIGRPAFEYGLREEIRKIGLDCQFSTERNGWRLSTTKPTIFFCSFANLQKIRDEVRTCSGFIRLIIVDELYLFSNPKTQRSRILKCITRGYACCGLSGTVLPAKDNFAIWGQCCALHLESRIARNATDFRSRYQTHFQANFGRGDCLIFKNAPNYKEKIYERLAGHIDVCFPKSLNRSVVSEVLLDLTSQQKNLIKQLLTVFFLQIEEEVVEQSFTYTFQTLNKIRGILNGWVEDNGRLIPVQSQKVDYILEKLEELHNAKEQCICWCAFRNDIKHLSSLAKFASLQMVGGKPFDIQTWKKGKIRTVFATMGSGSSVDFLANVPYAKFFSLSYKPLDLEQSQGRNDRRSTTLEKIFYEFLLCRNSLDCEIYKHLKEAKRTEQEFIHLCQTRLMKSILTSVQG